MPNKPVRGRNTLLCFSLVLLFPIFLSTSLHAFQEAEAYDGISLIIAYSRCTARGIEMSKGPEQQKLAVQTCYRPLYHSNPALSEEDTFLIRIVFSQEISYADGGRN